eukprot:CAMPEP_0177394782 /NCGR_PEP_ID=MMETSP0368-20130122/55747_1 /TAXON_ID=447022 ORGANISM="Scrippsiella hangoei-like, Strain SHHI-4" /NCGR_SAMPLE_ID=MMETSP0368 /ASSEMBLY_ACC=CAM_ASM_000363 /LENGTH=139 /DNA_ID=CAMNT_0018861213 /DNA_START=86 /DNA_END=502 /DNA_ORIENTATION=-
MTPKYSGLTRQAKATEPSWPGRTEGSEMAAWQSLLKKDWPPVVEQNSNTSEDVATASVPAATVAVGPCERSATAEARSSLELARMRAAEGGWSVGEGAALLALCASAPRNSRPASRAVAKTTPPISGRARARLRAWAHW